MKQIKRVLSIMLFVAMLLSALSLVTLGADDTAAEEKLLTLENLGWAADSENTLTKNEGYELYLKELNDSKALYVLSDDEWSGIIIVPDADMTGVTKYTVSMDADVRSATRLCFRMNSNDPTTSSGDWVGVNWTNRYQNWDFDNTEGKTETDCSVAPGGTVTGKLTAEVDLEAQTVKAYLNDVLISTNSTTHTTASRIVLVLRGVNATVDNIEVVLGDKSNLGDASKQIYFEDFEGYDGPVLEEPARRPAADYSGKAAGEVIFFENFDNATSVEELYMIYDRFTMSGGSGFGEPTVALSTAVNGTTCASITGNWAAVEAIPVEVFESYDEYTIWMDIKLESSANRFALFYQTANPNTTQTCGWLDLRWDPMQIQNGSIVNGQQTYESEQTQITAGDVFNLALQVANYNGESWADVYINGEYTSSTVLPDYRSALYLVAQNSVGCVDNMKVTAGGYYDYWNNLCPDGHKGSYVSNGTHTHSVVCSVCGQFVTEAHHWNDGVVTTPATHTTVGIKTYTCSDCGETKTEDVAKLPEHTHDVWSYVNMLTHKGICACGDEVIVDHTWDEGKVTVEPSHLSTGVKTYTCSDCGATKTETLDTTTEHSHSDTWQKHTATQHKKTCECGDALYADHNWDNGVVTTPATHTTVGIKTYTCSDCGETKTEELAKTATHAYGDWQKYDKTQHKQTCACGDVVFADHSWNDGEITTPATHLTVGIKTYTCSDCGETKTEEIAKIAEHTHGAWEQYSMTQHKKVCECGNTVFASHTWDNGVVTTPATHTTVGIKTYTCSDCGETKTEELVKTATHAYGDWQKYDKTQHKQTCACGDIVFANHTWNDGVVTTPATHTTVGIKTYTCSDCGETKTEEIAKAATHAYGHWQKYDKTQHKQTCACGDIVFENHTWDNGVVTTPATHTTVGIKTYTCSDCGETKTEEIAKTAEHTHGAWEQYSMTQHKKVCECGNTVFASHTWDNGVVTTPATHTTVGIKTYTCECGETKTEEIAKTAEHVFGEWEAYDDEQHKRSCTCGEVELEDHSYKKGEHVCTVCAAEIKPETTVPTTEAPNGSDPAAGCEVALSGKLAILLLAMTGLACMVTVKKKKK